MLAMHLKEALGPGVIRLHLLVTDRPGGRDAVIVAQFAKVLFAQPIERRAIHFGRPANHIVNLRLEGFVFGVVPGVRSRCSDS